MENTELSKEERLWKRVVVLSPIVKAAIMALIKFEEGVDGMGYDLSYYQEDLPKVVEKAIEPWKVYG